MIAGLQAALIIAVGMLAGTCLVWLMAIACIDIGDYIHRIATRTKNRDTD